MFEQRFKYDPSSDPFPSSYLEWCLEFVPLTKVAMDGRTFDHPKINQDAVREVEAHAGVHAEVRRDELDGSE